jgi:6-phosphogluconolactonase
VLQRLGAALLAASFTVLTGCSSFFTAVNNNPGGGTSTFAYVANAGGTLGEYSLTSGALAALSGSPATLPLAPTCIAISPNNAFLYVGTATGVFMYTIGSDGTLTEGNDDTVVYINQNGYQVQSMVVDATSSWLIMTYQKQTEIDALPISATTGLAGTTVYTASLKASVTSPNLAITPANSQVIVSLGSTGTEVIGFTPTASASPFAANANIIAPVSGAYAATAAAADPNSTYLYITEESTATTPGAGKLRLFQLANLTTELSGSPYATGIGPSAVLPDKSGAYVYVANQTDGTLSGYTINTTSQALTAFSTTIPTANAPIALAEDSSKTYIYAVGGGTNPNLWLYTFDSADDGTLDIKTTTSTLSTNPSNAIGLSVTD